MSSWTDLVPPRFMAEKREQDSEKVLDSETGIIRWVSEIPIDPGEPEIFNFSAKMCDSGKIFPVGCFDSNGGAGLTREAAFRAAVGEAIERYCCSIYFPDELFLGNHTEISKRSRALSPNEVALFHPRQKEHIRYAWWTKDTPLCWTEGVSLKTREPVLIPACLVYIPYYPFYRQRGELTVASSISTGQASAFARNAALLSGIYEVVERDAFMITWRNRLNVPRVDINSSPLVRRIYEEKLKREYLEYSLFNMTTDLNIPAILCMIVDNSRQPPIICFGGAANLSPEKAALKALVEAVQTREWAKFMGNQPRPMIIESDYSNIDDFEKHVFLYAYGNMLHAVSFLRESLQVVPFSALPDHAMGDTGKELRFALAALEAQGYEAFAVDLTTPDVAESGFSVVKVLIPLLHPMEGDHTHPYLGGRRLYEVPRKLGYPVEHNFESLNRDPHPYP